MWVSPSSLAHAKMLAGALEESTVWVHKSTSQQTELLCLWTFTSHAYLKETQRKGQGHLVTPDTGWANTLLLHGKMHMGGQRGEAP